MFLMLCQFVVPIEEKFMRLHKKHAHILHYVKTSGISSTLWRICWHHFVDFMESTFCSRSNRSCRQNKNLFYFAATCRWRLESTSAALFRFISPKNFPLTRAWLKNAMGNLTYRISGKFAILKKFYDKFQTTKNSKYYLSNEIRKNFNED